MLAVLFNLKSTPSLAQFEFVPDSGSLYEWSWHERIDSIFKLSKDNDFELRFTITSLGKCDFNIFILSAKEAKWNARLYQMECSDTSFKWIERKSNNDPEKLWKKLKANQLLTLPSAEDIKDSTGEPRYIPILDGASYTFILINKKGHRTYGYHCLKSYAEDFPEVAAYHLALRNVRLILDFFDEDERMLCTSKYRTFGFSYTDSLFIPSPQTVLYPVLE